MRNVKNLILCLLMLVAVSLTAGDGGGMHNEPESPIRLLVQYDFENIAPNQGVGVPAPPSFVSDELVTASELGIVQGSGVALLNDPYRDGVVVGPGPTQQMSFQQGITQYHHIEPELYNFFEFSMAAVSNPLEITSISFLTGHNYPGVSDCEGIIEYRASNGDLLGSDTFVIPNGFVLAPVSIVPSTTLVVGTQTTFFRIRFNEEVYGMYSWTVQLRIDDVELYGAMYAAVKTQQLIDKIVALELPAGIENSLVSKLENAINSIQKAQEKAAANKLEAFINEVEAQRGKKIPEADADALIALAQAIIEILEAG
jgi:hypothetical protein